MPSEIVEIAFGYRAIYRLPRRRSFEDSWFRASLPLEIECLTDAEAPVVCRVRNSLRAKDADEQYDYVVRAYDGKFWRHCGRDYDDHPVTLDDLKVLAAAPPGGPKWGRNPFLEIAAPDPERRNQGSGWINGLPVFENVGAKEIVRCGRADAEARLRRGVENYRLIDGILCEPCLEPRIAIWLDGNRLRVNVLTEDENPTAYHRAVFRADRLAEARKFCALLARQNSVPSWGMPLWPRIEVPHPEFLQRDDLIDAVRLLGPSIMKDIRAFAPWLPRGLPMEAYLDMRDSFDLIKKGNATRSDAEAFCRSYAKTVAWAEIHQDEDHPEDMPYGLKSYARDSRSLLGLWTRFEGGRSEPVLADEDGAALSSLGPGMAA